jgi:putative transcriptional regulator
MPKLRGTALREWEQSRDLNAELEQSIADIENGRLRRYTVESPTPVAQVRIAAHLSQAEFAAMLGVSKRTLEQWEQGRRQPSGAAKTLLKIAEKFPDALKAVAG